MILQALRGYYQRLLDDPESDVPTFGFRAQNIDFCLVLSHEGQLVQVQDLRVIDDRGKPRSRKIVLPYLKTRTSGDWPNFLWDNTGYVLGADSKNPKKALKRFKLFQALHETIAQDCDDPDLRAICGFLAKWRPERAQSLDNWEDLCDSQVVFRLRGAQRYAHESPALREAWVCRLAEELDSQPGTSLVSGLRGDIATMHPTIQGVAGCNTTGAMIVSFNATAFTSYGRGTDNLNAPVTLAEAFEYTTALNTLLAARDRRVGIGDATTIFWTDKPSIVETIASRIFGGSQQADAAEDEGLTQRVRHFLDSLRQGRREQVSEELGDPGTRYYILGLSPNTTRISVRFFLTGTVAEFADRLARHLQDVEIVGLRDDRPPTIRQLLRHTAREAKDIPPLLEGGLMRAILADTDYPTAFYQAIIRRIRADRQTGSVRAAAIKAVLSRNYRKEITVSLDPERPDPAYQLGRWFALLEIIQADALGRKLNTTVKDRFYASASVNPGGVFPRMIQLSQHHLRKLTPGQRTYREKQIQQVADRLEAFPARLDLPDQGLFHIGYYHQVQDLYTSKQDQETTDTETPDTESE